MLLIADRASRPPEAVSMPVDHKSPRRMRLPIKSIPIKKIKSFSSVYKPSKLLRRIVNTVDDYVIAYWKQTCSKVTVQISKSTYSYL
jgi:hypothetical protein